jgi:hypothetical protein
LYHRRAASFQSRPIHLAYHAGGFNERGRQAIMKELEDNGLATFISDETVMKAALDGVPDSFGLSEAEIAALPLHVRNFRCGNQIEAGDPYCGEQKFNRTVCATRRYQTSWHPGWKWHSVMGHLAAFFLLAAVEDALVFLSGQTASASDLYRQFKDAEDAEYEVFANAPVPDYFAGIAPESDRKAFAAVLPTFVQGPRYCHTARLQAEIRHLGILTETTALLGVTGYDRGTPLSEALGKIVVGGSMPLVYDDSENIRQKCPVPINYDFIDWFQVQSGEEWKALTIPNDAEIREYGNHSLYGLVAICYGGCDWGNCPKGVLGHADFAAGKFAVQVNGIAVTNLTSLGECDVLRHGAALSGTDGSAGDHYRFPLNANGRAEIRARITAEAEAGSYVRFSSLIVW